ncbi:MAG: type II toxin-antitoxin system HipA family toxin YjjJ [Immundisolibacteraceae bacterium]|nr:type II toxin-antitoxin system HipA family toxin YjjJ [Immundisolibacteraceae bacterium]
MPISIRQFLAQGPATSKQIQEATELKQSAVSTALREMGARVVTFKKGRSPFYAMTCNAFGSGDSLPLTMVDAYGNNTTVALVRPLLHGGFYLQPKTGMPAVLAGEQGDGFFDDLPYFLSDLRPQGFLGRQIAAQMAEQSAEFPTDPRNWRSDHVGQYLIANGDDLPGNFKLGPQARLRIRSAPEPVTSADYPRLVEQVLAGSLPGSSAGGEQPKFTAFCTERSAHVIVKFSPLGNDPVARRWRDILITEFYATLALHEGNLPAAETRLIEEGGRLFLESQRFDRIGEYGRMPMISLQAVDTEFVGLGTSWHQVMLALARQNLVSDDHLRDLLLLCRFGELINNSDMHLGNISLGVEGDQFRLLPAYDMCSMGFAPIAGGEVPSFQFVPIASRLTDENVDQRMVERVEEMARNFWSQVAADERISDEFREFLTQGNPVDRMEAAEAEA